MTAVGSSWTVIATWAQSGYSTPHIYMYYEMRYTQRNTTTGQTYVERRLRMKTDQYGFAETYEGYSYTGTGLTTKTGSGASVICNYNTEVILTTGAGWVDTKNKDWSQSVTATANTNTTSNLSQYIFTCSGTATLSKITVSTEPTSWSVTFNANGGHNPPAAQTKIKDVALTITEDTPGRSGYTFKNWNTAANGSGTAYASGASYTGNAALTLYAQWTANYVAPAPSLIHDCSIKVGGTWYKGDVWIKVSNTWYRAVETAIKVGGTWYGGKVI